MGSPSRPGLGLGPCVSAGPQLLGPIASVGPQCQHRASVPIQLEHQCGSPGRRGHSPRGEPGTGAGEEGRTGAAPEQSPIPGRAQTSVQRQRGSPAPSRPRCQHRAPPPLRDLSSHSAQAQHGAAVPARPDPGPAPGPAIPGCRRAPSRCERP